MSPFYRGNYSLSKIVKFDGSKVEDPFACTIDEEVDYARNCSIYYQEGYQDRIFTLEASKEIIEKTFNFKVIDSGAEFGCGAYGWLYNYLLPQGIKWKQFDINPKIVESNMQYSNKFFKTIPPIEIGNLYEMPIKDSSVDVIAGLSSWDSIHFYEKAIEEVNRCLKPGGWFVHYQDLHPDDTSLLLTEARKRLERGLNPDVPCEFYREIIPGNIPGSFMRQELIFAIDSLAFGIVRLGEYLTKHLAKLFELAGFNIQISDEVINEVIIERHKFNTRLREHGYKHEGPENKFASMYGKFVKTSEASVPDGYIEQFSSMDVLVAQKP